MGYTPKTGGGWGSLGERAAGRATPRAEPPQVGRHVEVECGTCWQPGVMAHWVRTPSGWQGLCAWVDPDDGLLCTGLVESGHLRTVE